ncbi:MAG: hypothetical protein ACFNLH_05835, partial [Corynebacterium matruchotii]
MEPCSQLRRRCRRGLDKPTSGKVTVNGHPYRELSAPLCEVGALLDAKGLHGSRSARSHLRQLAASNGIPTKRVDEVLEKIYAFARRVRSGEWTGITCRPNGRRKATGPTTGNNCGYVNNRANMRANPNASPYSR